MNDVDRRASECRDKLGPFFEQVARVIVGQRPMVDRLVIGMLVGGHVLLEGVPGLAKTLLVRTAASALSLQFARVQFTPDLLPADVIGTQVFHPQSGNFAVKKGPIFANIVLADEINRAPAKVQSALLEAMQEMQVTIGEQSFPLPQPFLVLATQNPIEHEGTYPLPEAQLDRFLFKVKLDYPSAEEEAAVVDRMSAPGPLAAIQPVLSPSEITQLREAAESTYVDEKVKRYAIDIVRATRLPASGEAASLIQYGAGPRASVGLVRAAKANALCEGRGYVVPHDVKSLAPDILRHRLVLSYEAEADGLDADAVIAKVLSTIPVP